MTDFDIDRGFDSSKIEHTVIDSYVKKAVAGLEIRSSAFLIEKYEKEMNHRTETHLKKALNIKEKILSGYIDILEHPKKKRFITILNSITEDTIHAVNFRRPSWHATERLTELSLLFKELKENILVIQKRNYLSITPKVEDLKVVYHWAEKFDVPHYYIQVFFDKSYGISFHSILKLLADPEKENEHFEISKDIKNQNKTTIKINTRKTTQIGILFKFNGNLG